MAKPVVSEEQWGQLWAKALIDLVEKEKHAKSPREAAKHLIGKGQENDPLFDDEYTERFYEEVGKLPENVLMAIIEGQINPDDLTDPRVLQIQNALNAMSGDEWFLLDPQGQLICSVSQAIDGWPIAPNRPLTRWQWFRIYTAAYEDPEFKLRLRINPTAAVEEFDQNHTLGHVQGAPLFLFPSLGELMNNPANPFPSQADLEQTLQDLSNNVSKTYKTKLHVKLSC